MFWPTFNVRAALKDIHDFTRYYSNLLTEEELLALPWKEWLRYARENLWDRKAESLYSKKFDELSLVDKMDVDLHVMLDIIKAREDIERKEREHNGSDDVHPEA